MYEAYGRAVVEDRVRPRHLAELAEYLRWEYGPATGPGYVLAAVANGSAKPRKGRAALVKALRALVPRNGNGRKAKAPNPTR